MGTFPAALPKLQAALPQWFAASDPGSELYRVLAAAGRVQDELGATFDAVSADRSLRTCSAQALYDQYAYVYGLQNEQLPPTPDGIRSLMTALAGATATPDGMVRVLCALLLITSNLTPGTILTFPSSGGLTFPADGSGLPLFQFTSTPPLTTVGIAFAIDGSGVTFPADGSGLTFPAAGLVTIVQSQATFSYTVQVGNYLAFDRGTFARLVQRLRPSHLLPPVIQEVP